VENARIKNPSFVAKAGFFTAILSAFIAVLSGMGTRFEVWDFHAGLTMLRWAAFGGLAATVLSLVGIFLAFGTVAMRALAWAVLGFFLGIILVAVPLNWLRTAKNLPLIHDISTDTVNPPQFIEVLPLRKDALNSFHYGGRIVAEQQRMAYPDILPLTMAVSTAVAFQRALAVGRGMGWKIIDENQDEGRIEAVATTFWFGFRDDIVIRIVKSDSGSRVDVRSASRVGISDMGTNAKRIRKFLNLMRKP